MLALLSVRLRTVETLISGTHREACSGRRWLKREMVGWDFLRKSTTGVSASAFGQKVRPRVFCLATNRDARTHHLLLGGPLAYLDTTEARRSNLRGLRR